MFGFGMSGGREIQVTHVQVVALYEPESGRIKHLHMVTSLNGAKPLSTEEATAEATARARGRNADIATLGVALSNDAEHGLRPHRIDPKTKAFVPLESERGGLKAE